MNTRRSQTQFINPFVTWSRLMMKTGEMVMASAQVVGHRTSRMALAGPAPGARDRREFALMGQEKGEAAMEAAQAAGMQMQALGQQLAELAFKQMMSTSAALISIAASRSPAQSVARQSKLMHDSINRSVAAAATISGSPARIAQHALHLVHKRVNDNVIRLRKA